MAQFTSGSAGWKSRLAGLILLLGVPEAENSFGRNCFANSPHYHQSPILTFAGWSFFAAGWLLVGRGMTFLGFQSLSGLCGCPCVWAAGIAYFSCLKSFSRHLLPHVFCFQPKALGFQPVAPQWLPCCEDVLCHHRVLLPPFWHEQLPLFCG